MTDRSRVDRERCLLDFVLVVCCYLVDPVNSHMLVLKINHACLRISTCTMNDNGMIPKSAATHCHYSQRDCNLSTTNEHNVCDCLIHFHLFVTINLQMCTSNNRQY